MGYIGPAAAYQVINSVGGSEWNSVTMTAIAGAESTWNTDATSPTSDYGLLQINVNAWPQLFQQYNWRDAHDNAVMALDVWREQGYNAWSTYWGGQYLKYLDTARSVASGGSGGGGGGGGLIDTPAPPGAGGYGSAALISGSADFVRAGNRSLVRWANAIAAIPPLRGI